MAADEDGTILGGEGRLPRGRGRVPARRSAASAVLTTMIFPGPYRIPAYGSSSRDRAHEHVRARVRTAGPWMFETVAREQMMDVLAARLGIDPLELRRRNVIRDDELPYTMASGMHATTR